MKEPTCVIVIHWPALLMKLKYVVPLLWLVVGLCASAVAQQALGDNPTEASLGVLPENAAEQPHFLPLSTDSLPTPSAAALVDTTAFGMWDDRFGLPGLDGPVTAMATDGPNVFVAGKFTNAGGKYVNHVARWDGSSWQEVGGGVDGSVYAIAVRGDLVYVAGAFTHAGRRPARNIAVFNRKTGEWGALGDGIGGHQFSYVSALCFVGDQLFVGGRFLTAGEIVAVNIARWNGTRWGRVGTGANGYIFAMETDGTSLYVGGRFTVADDKPIRRIARVDPATNQWTELAGGLSDFVSTIYKDPRDGALYVGGAFRSSMDGKTVLQQLARYDAANDRWQRLGGGISSFFLDTRVYAILAVGKYLYVGGIFDKTDTLNLGCPDERGIGGRNGTCDRTYNLVRWDGQQWDVMRRPAYAANSSGLVLTSTGQVLRNLEIASVTVLKLDRAGALLIGGEFNYAGPLQEKYGGVGVGFARTPDNIYPNNICTFDGDSTWAILGNGMGGPLFALSHDPVANDLIVAGSFASAGGVKTKGIARWNITSGKWAKLKEGINGTVRSVISVGGDVYATGTFATIDGQPVNHLARWSRASNTWAAVGTSPLTTSGFALAADEQNIYLGGNNGAFVWSGSAWSPLGGNLNGAVRTIVVQGDKIYVGGSFSKAGNVNASNIAVWDKGTQQWSPLGSGAGGAVNGMAFNGGDLYIGGQFNDAGGAPCRNVAVWRASTQTWAELGEGITGPINAVAVQNGSVFFGGSFYDVEGRVMDNIARWSGDRWYDVYNGVLSDGRTTSVNALLVLGDDLYVGGTFIRTGGVSAYYIGRWTRFTTGFTSSVIQQPATAAAATALPVQCYPNPSAGQLSFSIPLATAGDITISIVASDGRQVATLSQPNAQQGTHSITYHGDDLPAGTYFYRVQQGERFATGTWVILR